MVIPSRPGCPVTSAAYRHQLPWFSRPAPPIPWRSNRYHSRWSAVQRSDRTRHAGYPWFITPQSSAHINATPFGPLREVDPSAPNTTLNSGGASPGAQVYPGWPEMNWGRLARQKSNTKLCSTHESWVKFDSTLTQMSRVTSRVDRENQGYESSQSRVTQIVICVRVESVIFRGENVKILQLSVTLQRKNQPTATFDRPPPPSQQLFPKLGKMWWVVSQIWLNSDSTHLSQTFCEKHANCQVYHEHPE